MVTKAISMALKAVGKRNAALRIRSGLSAGTPTSSDAWG